MNTRPISSHHDQANEVSHEIVLQPNNHMKELQYEFHSSSHGFPCFDFPRLLLQEIFPLELRRIFCTGNRHGSPGILEKDVIHFLPLLWLAACQRFVL